MPNNRVNRALVEIMTRRGLLPPEALPPRPTKYRAVPTEVAGVRFASQKEARRWGELQMLEQAGGIGDLQRQVSFGLVVNGLLVCRYQADFTYQEAGHLVVEDCKSPATRTNRAYRIKCKLLRACHGLTIRES